jgi:hypothetical protein
LSGVPKVGVPGKLLKFGFLLPMVLTKADEWQVMHDAWCGRTPAFNSTKELPSRIA